MLPVDNLINPKNINIKQKISSYSFDTQAELLKLLSKKGNFGWIFHSIIDDMVCPHFLVPKR